MYNTSSHSKYILQYHLVFVCKYRRKILQPVEISNHIKHLSKEISIKKGVEIKYMETDKDHIHYLISTKSNINLSSYVKTLKSYTTYHIWKDYGSYLKNFIYGKRVFWSSGYFINTIGNVSEENVKNYILNQGR